MDRIRSRGQPTTLSLIDASTAGFTLIEILIVLSLIAMVMSFGLPAISQVTGQKLNSTARQFVGIMRSIRTDAILLNSIYRLTFDLDKNTYVVESQKKFEFLSEAVPQKKKLSKKEKEEEKEKEQKDSNFGIVDKYSKEPKKLPSGLVFDGVIKEREGLLKEGLAYVYFFPGGFNEQAIIYLDQEGSRGKGYSLILRPTAGRVEILKTHVKDF